MRHFLIAGLLLIPVASTVSAETSFQLPAAESQKWVQRLSRLVGAHMWTVSANGNEIVLKRKEPVAFNWSLANISAAEAKNPPSVPDGIRNVQFVLRFAPKLSFDEYERLAAINAASAKEEFRLRGVANLSHKFDDFIATTPEEKQRLLDYREAVSKLPRHHLPQCYTPDNSVYLYRSWAFRLYPADKAIYEELQRIQEDVIRYLGLYDIQVSSNEACFEEASESSKDGEQ